jgi:3-hydroxypropanoate dehydrogenase
VQRDEEGRVVSKILSDDGLDLLFRKARTHSYWLDGEVSDVLLEAVYDLAKMPPTSANSSPMRILFVRSQAAKERLRPALMAGNVDKTMSAPATAIIGYDTRFYELLPRLFPHEDARSWFEGDDARVEDTAFRNGTLQGAYFMLAARALGLDCGPMSGFDRDMVDREFFPDGRVRSNFLCNLAYGDADRVHPRLPRLDFEDACQFV